jgi:hypothetical protein
MVTKLVMIVSYFVGCLEGANGPEVQVKAIV